MNNKQTGNQVKKTQIQKAASALSKLGNVAKWAKNDTPEKRRACTAAATDAATPGRIAIAAARRIEKIRTGQLVFRAVTNGKFKGMLRLLPPLRVNPVKENK